jgi:hypothetical protein
MSATWSRRVLCVVCTLSAILNSVSAKSCEHAYNALQTDVHNERLRAMTNPIQDAALLVYRESPGDKDAVGFAHRLLRTHDNFTETCYDHHWTDSLTHKLCASFLKWREWLVRKCGAGPDSPGEGRWHGAGTSMQCMCSDLDALLHACAHHVLPWATDEGFCDNLKPECAHAHPFAGLCRLHHSARTAIAARRRPATPTSAVIHNTEPKHCTWKKLKKAQAASQQHAGVHARLAEQKTRRPARANSSVGATWNSSWNSSATQPVLFVSALVSVTQRVHPSMGVHFDPRMCATYKAAGLRVCTISNLTAVARLIAWWAPGCEIVRQSESPCDIQIGWTPSIVRVYYDTPDRRAAFFDPRGRATRVVLRNGTESQGQWKVDMFRAAVLEYAHEVETVCAQRRRRPDIDIHDGMHEWLSCDR